MKIEILRRIAALSALALIFSGCLLPTSSTTVKGRVRDNRGRPVADAEVRFGGTGLETTVRTAADGTFTATARHRPSQMLNLAVSKSGVGSYADKFPGFAAPSEPIEIELMATIGTIPRTR